MEEKTVKYKSYAFALRIIKAYKFLSSEQRATRICPLQTINEKWNLSWSFNKRS